MFTVTFWQWIMELGFIMIFQFHLSFTHGKSKFFDEFWFVIFQLQMYVSNAFYLLGDRSFQRSVTEVGLFKAIWRAFTEPY